MPFEPGGTARRVELTDLAATYELARELSRSLGPGDVLALVGDLGAGKTELVRGLARALSVPPRVPVNSPSYLLLNVYRGGTLPLAHFDAYFMASADELERAGLAELRAEGCAIVIEWADRVRDALPEDSRWVHLEPGSTGAGSRCAIVDAPAETGP